MGRSAEATLRPPAMFGIFFQPIRNSKSCISKAFLLFGTIGRDLKRKDLVFAGNNVREIPVIVGYTVVMKSGGRHA